MNPVVDYIWHVPKVVGTVLASGLPSHHQAEVMPVLWALLLATLVLTVLVHWRHAIGSIAIPAGIPVLPGGVPLLGHAIPVLRNLHRCVRPRCGVYEAYSACSYVHRLPNMLTQALPRAVSAAVTVWWFVDRKYLGPIIICKLLRNSCTSWLFKSASSRSLPTTLVAVVDVLHGIRNSAPTHMCRPQLAGKHQSYGVSFAAFSCQGLI